MATIQSRNQKLPNPYPLTTKNQAPQMQMTQRLMPFRREGLMPGKKTLPTVNIDLVETDFYKT